MKLWTNILMLLLCRLRSTSKHTQKFKYLVSCFSTDSGTVVASGLLEILRNIEKDMKHETQVLTVISVIMHFLV